MNVFFFLSSTRSRERIQTLNPPVWKDSNLWPFGRNNILTDWIMLKHYEIRLRSLGVHSSTFGYKIIWWKSRHSAQRVQEISRTSPIVPKSSSKASCNEEMACEVTSSYANSDSSMEQGSKRIPSCISNSSRIWTCSISKLSCNYTKWRLYKEPNWTTNKIIHSLILTTFRSFTRDSLLIGVKISSSLVYFSSFTTRGEALICFALL